MPRWVSLVVVPLLALGGAVGLGALPASAVTVLAPTIVFQDTVNGDFVQAGNGVLECAERATGTGGVDCDDLHGGSTNGSPTNDMFVMKNTNAANIAGAANSSSAAFTIPLGASVVRAELSWAANTGVWQGSNSQHCGTRDPDADTPSGTPENRALKLRIGNGSVQTVPAPGAANVYKENPVPSDNPQYYSTAADVTNLFSGVVGTGTAQTVSVGNIWAAEGPNCFAGWSLALVYDFGSYDPANPATAAHNVTLYQSHVRQAANDNDQTIEFSGFTAIDGTSRLGFTAYEGDLNITGDQAFYQPGTSGTWYELENSRGNTDNIGISVAQGSVNYAGTSGTFYNANVDVATQEVAQLTNGDTRLRLKLRTDGDSYLFQGAILSVPVANVTIDKSFDGTTDVQDRTAGEPASFTITVTNNGSTKLDSFTITDDLAPGCAQSRNVTLDPSQSFTFTCVGPAPSGHGYTNTAAVSAEIANSSTVVTDRDDSRVNLSAIDVQKSGSLASGATGVAGDLVNYGFTITNTGESALDAVALVDALAGLSDIAFGTWPGAPHVLAPGAHVDASATYALTQADVDAGTVLNTVQAKATDPDGGPKVADDDNNTIPIVSRPGIDLVKTGSIATGAAGNRVGDLIHYTFEATNTGNVTLRGVTITDPKSGVSPIAYGGWPNGTAGVLEPGQKVTATADYALTQADLDAGEVDNTGATAGTPPTGPAVGDTDPEKVVVTQGAAIDLQKVGALADGDQGFPGDTIEYRFTATNTGNVTLTGVAITDPKTGLSAITYGGWPHKAGVLAPGESVTASATYVITQADVDAGEVDNTAATQGTSPSGAKVDDTDPETVVINDGADIRIVKTGVLAGGSSVGDTVDYRFEVTNTGNVTLTGVGVADLLPGLSSVEFGAWPSGTDGTLHSQQTVVATATYVLTQADVDAGEIYNLATTTGTPPSGGPVDDDDDETVLLPSAPSIDLAKHGVLATGATGRAGDVVEYGFTATNTGNVTLTNVTIDDPLAGLSAVFYGPWPDARHPNVLAPGASVTGTATYVLTQADVDTGTVDNTATVVGTPPTGDPVDAEDSATVVLPSSPAIDIVKTGALAAGATGAVGDTVEYRFSVENIGNVTLTGVTITDPLPGLSAVVFDAWPAADGVLLPGESVTASATYTLTQADLDAGSVVNLGTATGTPPTGAPVTDQDPEIISLSQQPAIQVTKTARFGPGTRGATGDTVNYGFTVTNVGNVVLTGVALDDPMPGLSAVVFDAWPAADGVLLPGESVTATATYELTAADVTATRVDNTVTASGLPPTGAPVTDQATATLRMLPDLPTLSLPGDDQLALTGTSLLPSMLVAFGMLALGFAFMAAAVRRRMSRQ